MRRTPPRLNRKKNNTLSMSRRPSAAIQTSRTDCSYDRHMDIGVRPLDESDLRAADQILRVAFGTFLGVPDPGTFMGDAEFVRPRWRADPSAAFGAFAGDELAGSVFLANWGSIGFVGPLTIRPDLWDRGIAKRLMEATVATFDAWGTRVAGLYTFSNSQKHIGLYQRFGFWPRFLNAFMSKAVAGGGSQPDAWTKLSDVPPEQHEQLLASCREVAGAIYQGLDLSIEIRAVARQHLGDTVLVWRDGRLAGFAVCHCGAGTEAGSGSCYVKFAGVRPGPHARDDFDRLLNACEDFAAAEGATRLKAGVSTGRHEAHVRMLERGFRAGTHGVIMHRPNEPAYDRPGIYALEDWR